MRQRVTRLDLCAWMYAAAGVVYTALALTLPDPYRRECAAFAVGFVVAGLCCSAVALRRRG